MKTIKYCTKNEKLGTKQVYKALKKEFPDIKQKQKSCLSECKSCRKQPIALVGKKTLICEETPELLYAKLVEMIHASDDKKGKKEKKKAKK